MEANPPRRVLLIGWDAADWKILHPLLDAGKMPHLASLIDEGVCGNLATLQPALSPMLWTSIATGKRAYAHGIHGFSEPDPVTGGIRPVSNLSRRTKAIWNILNQTGHRSVTIGWWPSHPAEELSRGVVVSNEYPRAPDGDPAEWSMKPGTVHPRKLETLLAARRVQPTRIGEEVLRKFLSGLEGMSPEELDRAAQDPRVRGLAGILADGASIHAAAVALMHATWDFMGIYHDGIDHFGHLFMGYHPPRLDHVDEWEYRLFNHCLEAGYRLHDEMLGALLALAGPEVTVIVMSDHGFHPDHLRPRALPREPAGPASEHRQFGILVARGPGLRRDDRIHGANLLDICPTLLHLFGLPVGQDMEGKVLLDLYEDPAGVPVERIPSWDAVPGEDGMHPPDRQIPAADSKAAIDQLVALGYIERPDEDAGRALALTIRELDYNLALARLDGGLYREAVAGLERLYRDWPMEHRFGYYLALGYQRTGRNAELRMVVDTLIARRLEEARLAAEELKGLKPLVSADGNAVQESLARRIPGLLAKARPNLFALRYLEAFADFAERRFEDALGRLVELDSDYGARLHAIILRGEILQQLRRWPEARAAFEEALAIDPETPPALIGLARNDLAGRRFADAAAHARSSLGLLYFQPRAHYILGLALYRDGDWTGAEQAFRICVNQAPLFAPAHRMLAEIARRHHRDPVRWAHLRAHYRQVLEQRRSLAENAAAPAASHQAEPEPPPASATRGTALARTVPPPDLPAEDFITIVTGLPRSGTSLMMQVLDAAGLPLFTDGGREADESNQRGYHEHRRVAALRQAGDQTWLGEARGHALKVVAPLLSALPDRLPRGSQGPAEPVVYRVLFMERDLGEVLASQDRFLARLGESPQLRAGDLARAFRVQLDDAWAWCARPCVHVMAVSYAALVTSPETILPGIAAFLGVPGMEAEMRARIEPSLYRERRT